MLRRITLPTLLVAVLLGLSLIATPAHVEAQGGRQVWAYYFGWWTGESWGDGRLLDRPANPYDSRDGGTQGRQIDEARSGGIDAFIMSWFGPKNDNLTAQVFNSLLDQAAARGFGVAASVDMSDPGYNGTVDEVTETLRYLIADRIHHGGYLRYNGKAVIYFWNQGKFSIGDWRNIRDQVDPSHDTIWVMEGTNTNYLAVFDGLYLFNTAWAGNPGATARNYANLTRQAGGTFYTPTVLPGWNEDALASGRPNPTSNRDRANGQFLTNSWNGAISAGTDVVLIVSWNEYFENSHIEPSQNFGSQALDTLRPLIESWESGAPANTTSANAEAGSAGAPTGVTYTVNDNVRMRSAPSTAGDAIVTIPLGTTLDVIGRNADSSWLQVNFNGGSGWVAGWYGSYDGDVNSVPVTG